nr:hypothetical protein [Tanacetum cinerariifolium]
MRPRFVKAFHIYSAAILNKQGPVLARGFHSQQLIKDARYLGKQMTTTSLRITVNRIQNLYGSHQENDIWSVLDHVDLHTILQADKERLVGLLSLESDAKKLILKLQTI